VLINHINTVVGPYAGRMHFWNLVNEAIKVADKRADCLRKSPWLKFLGSDYIEIAFHAAAEADSKALLIYNENDLGFSTLKNNSKEPKC
jgi:endo-1,4-beta-xylanase